MRWLAWAALGTAAALRLYAAFAPQVGWELQDAYPRAAVSALVNATWSSPFRSHGTVLFLLLRALFTGWYALGRVLGLYEMRLDLLAAFARDVTPFVVAGRLVVVATSLASVWIVWRLGERLHDARTGLASAALLAVAFAHVRESYHVWPDVPAGAAAIAATWASLAAWRGGRNAAVALAGCLGGLAIATKINTAPIVLTVAIAAWGARGEGRVRRLLIAVASAIAAIALTSPERMLRPVDTYHAFAFQAGATFFSNVARLDALTYVRVGFGWPMAILAAVGLTAGLAGRSRREWLLPAVFLVPCAVLVGRSGFRYVRYLASILPFVALMAGYGAAVLSSRVGPRFAAPALALLLLLAGAEQGLASARLASVLGRLDTRLLAGRWIGEHAKPGQKVALPSALMYPNPTLPDSTQLERVLGAGLARSLQPYGIDVPGRTLATMYIVDLLNRQRPGFLTTRFVVTAEHPTVMPTLNTPPEVIGFLRLANARPVVELRSTPDPPLPDLLFDPSDAEYVPLRGAVERPGPNLVIWDMSPAPHTPPPD